MHCKFDEQFSLEHVLVKLFLRRGSGRMVFKLRLKFGHKKLFKGRIEIPSNFAAKLNSQAINLQKHGRKSNFDIIPNWVVSANTTNTFKSRLDKIWHNQDVIYNFKAQIHGTGSRSKSMCDSVN